MMRVFVDPSAFSPEQKTFFENWQKLSNDAKSRLDGKTFDTNVWRLLKIWLLKNFFYGKCAYCEVNVGAGDVGDAEHYRPKGALTERRGSRLAPVEKDGVKHGGYPWLAYDLGNLIPSCRNCNAVRGKRTQFPIEGTRVWTEADARDTDTADAIERPLLLHPCRHRDPRDHLVFTPDGGVQPLDEVGRATVEVLGLDRKDLVDLRRIHLVLARKSFAFDLGKVVGDANIAEIGPALDEIEAVLTAPDMPFSRAIGDLIRALRTQIVAQPANSNAPTDQAALDTVSS